MAEERLDNHADETLLNSAETTDQVIDNLNRAAWEQRELDPGQALEMARRSLTLARGKKTYLRGAAQALFTLGELAISADAAGLALTHLLEAYSLLEGQLHPDLLADICHSIGWVHFRLQNASETSNYLKQALNLARESSNPARVSEILTSLGAVQSYTGDHAAAIGLFQESLALQTHQQDARARAVTCNNLALAQMRSAQFAQALENCTFALREFRDLGLHVLETSTLDTLGQIHLAKGDLEQAGKVFKDCLSAARSLQRANLEMAVLLNLGKLYRTQGHADQAVQSLTQGLELAETHHSNSYRSQVRQILAEICEEQGDLKSALRHYQEFHQATEQTLAESARYRQENLKILHRVEKSQKDAEILWLQNRTLEREIDHRLQERDELERLATTDALTGLYNRQHFFTLGEYEFARTRQGGVQLTILILDIDHFKHVNDHYGHLTGDQVLTEIARLMTENARKDDICFRYGGEEFVFLLPGAGLAPGLEVAERIRRAIARFRFGSEEQPISITASLGVAETETQDSSLTGLLERADQALYRAKNQGRNQSVA